MRVLITGGEGQLGRALSRALGDGHEVLGRTRGELDVTDGAAVLRSVLHNQPDVVINCAAMTDTQACETDPDRAHRVNATGAGNVARTCEQTARSMESFVGISTNEVFDGTTCAPYREDDEPRAVNAYGQSKLEGERLIHAFGEGPAIVRTSWLYGDGEANFVAKVLAAARAGRTLRFVTDEVASPTSADDLAGAIVALIERGAPGGVYHLTNEGEASRYEWACEIVRLAGIDAPVEGITTAELRAAGYDGPRKPPYSMLANNNARALGITMRPWRDALAAHFDRHPELRAQRASAEPRSDR